MRTVFAVATQISSHLVLIGGATNVHTIQGHPDPTISAVASQIISYSMLVGVAINLHTIQSHNDPNGLCGGHPNQL